MGSASYTVGFSSTFTLTFEVEKAKFEYDCDRNFLNVNCRTLEFHKAGIIQSLQNKFDFMKETLNPSKMVSSNNMHEPMFNLVWTINWSFQVWKLAKSHDVQKNPGPLTNTVVSDSPSTHSISENVSSSKNMLCSIYMNLEKSIERKKFLRACVANNVLPSGLKLQFNLAIVPETEVVSKIQHVLDRASSDLLYILLDQAKKHENVNMRTWSNYRDSINIKHGISCCDRLVGAVRKECSPLIQNIVDIHMRKLDKLKSQNLNPEQKNKQAHKTEPFKGSLKIQARNLLLKNLSDYCHGKGDKSINGGNSLHTTRKHRKIRRGRKTKKIIRHRALVPY